MIVRGAPLRWLARRLAIRCRRITMVRKPDVNIGGQQDPYMRRWFLVPRNPILNVYLHQFLRDDDDRAPHDHPWVSASLSLTEPMVEIYRKGGIDHSREVLPGDLVLRGARFIHRMVVPKPGALTIFITGPRIRAWGFACDPPVGWRHWKIFTSPLDKGAIGRGCD
jgi:hypothetical protein